MSALTRYLEDRAYDNDHRVRAGRETSCFVVYDNDEVEHELPTTWGVCPTCGGEGKHVNPSIDCGGLTAEDFYEDPDLAEGYMRGSYDVDCYGCQGLRVVKVVDEARMTPELTALWEAEQRAAAECRAIEAAERRMGC